MKKVLLKLGKWIGILLAAVVLFAVGFILVLTVTEYKPEDTVSLAIQGNASKELHEGDSLTIMTWNIGFGALGDNADFFMDGGTHVMPSTKERVKENLNSILLTIEEEAPDVLFVQEMDENSKRTYHINEMKVFMGGLEGYQSSFAYNFKVPYVPYPIPPIGKVNSGIATFSSYPITDSTRVKLPCPFSYPVRIANLKRCLMVDRVSIEGSDKELVLVNLHLEAYDSGEGKAAQTKMLRDILEAEAAAGNYVIAGGDFNQEFSDVDVSAYPVYEGMWQPGSIDVSEFKEGLTFATDNSAATCRSLDSPYEDADKENFQYYLIDGFIVSSNVTIEEVSTLDLDFAASDHNPVKMRVTLH